MSLLRKGKALFFGLTLFFSALCGNFFFAGNFVLVLFVKPRWYRLWFDAAIGAWEWLVAALLEKLIGMKMVITGDRMRGGEQSLIIMNHRTCLDWLYFWSVLIRQSGVTTEKIILKSPLKHVPGAGWAMQAAGFMFLNRRWNEDESYLDRMLAYFHNINYKTQILLFPEGTDFSPCMKERSDKFALKSGLQIYKNVLHPRTTGFTYLVQQLKRKWPDAALYDVTIGYPTDSFPQTERDLFAGHFTPSAHFHIHRYAVSSLPDDAAQIDDWCRNLWKEKEDRLERFRVTRDFEKSELLSNGVDIIPRGVKVMEGQNGPESEAGESHPRDDSIKDLHCASDSATEISRNAVGSTASKSVRNSSALCGAQETSSNVELRLRLIIVLWFLFLAVFTYALITSVAMRWLTILHIAFFLYMDQYRGGFELFQADYYDKYFVRRNNLNFDKVD